MNFNKVIDFEDFNTEELRPYLQLMAEKEMIRFGEKKPTCLLDSKNWESAMALYSFEKHGLLKEKKLFAGIGAGTECLTEFLANTGAVVFPVDRYLEQTVWQDVAPAGFMVDRSEYVQEGTSTKNIIPVHSDARMLELPSNFFDGVYSSGSIEHFGGLDGVEAAAAEIGRILKPGGCASISTEFRLDGPNYIPWFDDNCILFTPDLLNKHIVKPSGLIPIDVLKGCPSPKTFETRKNLINFLESAKNIQTFRDKINAYPNLVLYQEGFLFCSVHIFLRKPLDWKPQPTALSKVEGFREQIRTNNRIAAAKIGQTFKSPSMKPVFPSVAENKWVNRRLFSDFLKTVNLKLKKTPKFRFYVFRFLFLFPRITRCLRKKVHY